MNPELPEALRVSEDALHGSSELLRHLVQESDASIFIKDLEGRYLLVNPRKAASMGLLASQILGRTDAELFAPEVAEKFRASDGAALRSPEPIRYEAINDLGARGRTFLIVKFRLHDSDGKPYALCGFGTDITERKKAEAALQQSEERARRQAAELQEADRRKDEFLAMLSHELRNPLAPIRSAVQVLMRSEAPRKDLVEMLDRQTAQLAHLVEDLLDAARVTQGKIALREDPLEVLGIVAQAVEASRPAIDARAHALTVSLPEQRLQVQGDLPRLAQALTNLLTNAAKYTPRSGTIALTVRRSAERVLIQVRDSGVGLTTDELPHVFGLFAQSQRSLDRSEGGLGVGLTLARKIAELHGGTLTAASEGLGRGSEFQLSLPLLAPSEATSEGPSIARAAAPVRAQRRVLVVDDNVDAAASIALLLELDGHHARVAHDGPEAIALAQTFSPELVLLDLGLPGMSGYEVIGQLRTFPALIDTPVVALTGYGREEDRRRTAAAGFNAHLTKPVEYDRLLELVNHLGAP